MHGSTGNERRSQKEAETKAGSKEAANKKPEIKKHQQNVCIFTALEYDNL